MLLSIEIVIKYLFSQTVIKKGYMYVMKLEHETNDL